jgi:proline dehydrogenase
MKTLLSHFAARYIAGETLMSAIHVAERLNASGLKATISNLGESIADPARAKAAVGEYLALLDEISSRDIDSHASIKLSHMGIDVSCGLALENAGKVAARAAELKNFVRMDMEGSALTSLTLDAAIELNAKHGCVGVAVQSALRRSADDVDRLIKEGVSVRLVKGAYREPPRIAFPDKSDVDKNYSALMRRLLKHGKAPAIATHDERLIAEAKEFAGKNDIGKDSFEFQMLLGINSALQKELAKEGYRVRIYVPYGPEWLPYILRRLAERKENVWFVLKHLFD